jgi:thiamine-monophosphate kinase
MPAGNHEFAFIEWIRQRAPAHPRVPLGIGDDAAIVRFPAPADCLIAADMLMDGTHFRLGETAPGEAGRKALAVNLSDIAAMAGRPLAAVVSVALPRDGGPDLARDLHAGLLQLADEFEVAVVGGDTNVWSGPLVINVTVLGEATGSGAVGRGGARPGDWILATGSFGGSLLGKHLSFSPRVHEALLLHERVRLHAMIDVSDGLAADLHHILDESQVAAVLDESAIPISDAAHSAGDGRTPLEHALADGEDFELLLTAPANDARRLLQAPPFSTPLTHIGKIVKGQGCEIQDAAGNRMPLPRSGWEHRF